MAAEALLLAKTHSVSSVAMRALVSGGIGFAWFRYHRALNPASLL
jgi:hypothetical protein